MGNFWSKKINVSLLELIINFFQQTSRPLYKYKELYSFCYKQIGGYKCYYSLQNISKQTFEGRIRSCIEEHSSDSRQHYFKNGVLQQTGWRKNLFSNKLLGEKNTLIKFQPYNTVRGDCWCFSPGISKVSIDDLNLADSLYKKKNCRRGTPIINDTTIYQQISYLTI